MQYHVESLLPMEACGLVAGRLVLHGPAYATMVIPVPNDLNSPTRFHMDEQAQLAAFQQIELSNLELLAIYHSHPHGPGYPSKTDIAEFWYPDTLMLILTPALSTWNFQAFAVRYQNAINCLLWD